MVNVNNNYTDMKNLTPFKLCVLQNFPFIEADFDAVTNYQLLCKVVEYLNKGIANINSQNDNIRQLEQNFITLYNYVKDFFDNLDVQEEINKKLDEMVADGTLSTIINQEIFSNINNKLNNTNYYTLEYFGCDNSGNTDCTNNFKNAIQFATNNNKVLKTRGGRYLITEDIDLDNVTLDLTLGTIVSNNNTISINNGYLKNGILEKTCVIVNRRSRLENITFNEFEHTAITTTRTAYETYINNISFASNVKSIDTVCLRVDSDDCAFENLYGYGGHIGLDVIGSNNRISNAHLWLNSNNVWDDSIYINMSGTANSILNSCCDSYYNCINNTTTNLTNYYEIIWTNNITLFNNKTFKTFNQMYGNGYCIFRMRGMADKNNTVVCENSYGLKLTTLDGFLNKRLFLNWLTVEGVETQPNKQYGTIRHDSLKTIFDFNMYWDDTVHVQYSITIDISNLIDMSNSRYKGSAVWNASVYLVDGSIKNAPCAVKNGVITVIIQSADIQGLFLNNTVNLNYE